MSIDNINQKNYKKLFIAFLDEHNAKQKFIKNVSDPKCDLRYTKNYRINELLKKVEPKSYLYNAFRWGATPQTHCFWDLLNKIWTRKLMKKNSDPK